MKAPRLRRLIVSLAALVVAGGAAVATTSAAQAVVPATRTVQVQVVPALAGVHFTLDGIPGVTGAGGTAVVVDTNLNGAAGRLSVPPLQQLSPTVRVSLDRVANDPNHGAFTRKLVAELDEDRAVTIGLLTPTKPKKQPLPLGKVTSITLTDSLGGTTRYTSADLAKPIWLSASRPALSSAGANGRLVTYAVKSVIIRGANVVNSGQQRFTPNKQALAPGGQLMWQFPVILHTLTIVANDLLAGAPAGKTAQLTFPDKSVETIPLGPARKVTIHNLPRGTYQLKVGGGLIALSSTVRLSRDQTATEVVITASDAGELALMLFSVLAVVVAAGVIGRRLRHQAAHRDEGTTHAVLA